MRSQRTIERERKREQEQELLSWEYKNRANRADAANAVLFSEDSTFDERVDAAIERIRTAYEASLFQWQLRKRKSWHPDMATYSTFLDFERLSVSIAGSEVLTEVRRIYGQYRPKWIASGTWYWTSLGYTGDPEPHVANLYANRRRAICAPWLARADPPNDTDYRH